MIPEDVMSKIPNQIIPLIYTGIIYLIVEKIQGDELKNHEANENEFNSNWKATGIGGICLLLIMGSIFVYAFYEPCIQVINATEESRLIF